MGVLVETGGDLTAVKRTAEFFLGSFENRVEDQESKRTGNKEEYEAEFKGKRTKEEKASLNAQPSIFNPQPSILNPQPSSLNPQPSTLNPQPSTLNPRPSTLNPQPSTLNLRS
jgi:hypothetical protein